jgi:hypothetical protein
LHALQALALVAIGLRRLRQSEAVRVAVMLSVVGTYASVFVVLLLQALRGQSIVQWMSL